MKITTGLIKLLKKSSSPEIVVKYIYKNVFELMKETQSQTLAKDYKKLLKQTKIIRDLSKYYSVYYEKIINNSCLEWPKTILPLYIYGHKNFYTGVAGRLALFSNDLEKEAANYIDRKKRYELLMTISAAASLSKREEEKKAAAEYLNCNVSDFFEKVDIYPWVENTEIMFEPIPVTYSWYGNPRNWSDCYEINLDKNNELDIRKSQILILESKLKDDEMDAEYQIYMGEILLITKGNLSYNYVDTFEKYPIYPISEASCNHIEDNVCIEKMMLDYITNVSKKMGIIRKYKRCGQNIIK